MRKDELEMLESIQKIEKSQIYLLQEPKTPQQQFLHLFAHRHLLKQKMLNKNIDNVMNYLQGSFAQSSLKLAYTTLCIQNRIQLSHQYSPLLGLIQGWIQFYSKINNKNRILITEIILQQHKSIDIFSGYDFYLTYLNLISVDLWKLIRNKNDQKQMFTSTALKVQVRACMQQKNTNISVNDLLNFVNTCLPSNTANIILKKQALPLDMRGKFQNYECLYSNQNAEYFLRTNVSLSYLLKHVFIILLSLQLNKDQQKYLMMIAFKYYYIYHYDKRYSASQIIIHSYNKVQYSVKMTMNHQFIFFCRTIAKLGKLQFVNFIGQSSDYMKKITEIALKQPVLGYPQESISPYNIVGIGQTIQIGRGLSVTRTFEVFEENSIFYFKITIPSLDITVRLYYLGEIASQKSVKISVLTQQKKSGELKHSINAMKKGLYMFEFDNSYSWLNGKKIKYENIVLTPLQIINENTEQWVNDFYENIYQNQVEDDDKVEFVSNKAPKPLAQTFGTAAISKDKNIFCLKVNKKQQEYIYQTDSSDNFKSKVAEKRNEKQKYRWTIQNKIVKAVDQIENFINGTESAANQQKQQEDTKAVGSIQQNEEDEEMQYQVVKQNASRSHIPQQKKKVVKQEPKKKEQIDYNSEQYSSLYQ